jgi:hypothetical protein
MKEPLNIIFINIDEDIYNTLFKVLKYYFEEKKEITDRLSLYFKAQNEDHPCLGVIKNGEPCFFNDVYFDFGRYGKEKLLKYVQDKINNIQILPEWVINNFLIKSAKFRIFVFLPPTNDSYFDEFLPSVIQAQLKDFSSIELHVFQRKRKEIKKTLREVYYQKNDKSKDLYIPVKIPTT